MKYSSSIKIGSRLISDKNPTYFIADIGANHDGDINRAKKLIRLSGLSIKDKINPKGDIEIITSGLRPGEKLYEELLIDETAQPTAHPRIFKALKNDNVDNNNFLDEVIQLENFLIKDQGRNSLRIIHKMVPEWKPFKKSYFE